MLPLLKLLEAIEANKYVETYRYFPDVVLSGGEFLCREDLDKLIRLGYLKTARRDPLGEFLELSENAKEIVQRNRGMMPTA